MIRLVVMGRTARLPSMRCAAPPAAGARELVPLKLRAPVGLFHVSRALLQQRPRSLRDQLRALAEQQPGGRWGSRSHGPSAACGVRQYAMHCMGQRWSRRSPRICTASDRRRGTTRPSAGAPSLGWPGSWSFYVARGGVRASSPRCTGRRDLHGVSIESCTRRRGKRRGVQCVGQKEERLVSKPDPVDLIRLGEAIRARRRALSLSQNGVARSGGIHRNYIGALVAGRSTRHTGRCCGWRAGCECRWIG